jgi:hypothetical protein
MLRSHLCHWRVHQKFLGERVAKWAEAHFCLSFGVLTSVRCYLHSRALAEHLPVGEGTHIRVIQDRLCPQVHYMSGN